MLPPAGDRWDTEDTMTGLSLEGPIYREPGMLARLFIYTFALSTPLLTGVAFLLPAAIVVRIGTDAAGITFAAAVTLAYVGAMAAALRRVRSLGARFTPPLALPGDIWNIGVAPPPRRSSNWPIRLRRRPPGGGRPRLAA
jgi:hypothetical protein